MWPRRGDDADDDSGDALLPNTDSISTPARPLNARELQSSGRNLQRCDAEGFLTNV
jgi:hypothetical protein